MINIFSGISPFQKLPLQKESARSCWLWSTWKVGVFLCHLETETITSMLLFMSRSGQPRPEVEPPGQQPRVPRVRQQRRRVSRPGPRVT